MSQPLASSTGILVVSQTQREGDLLLERVKTLSCPSLRSRIHCSICCIANYRGSKFLIGPSEEFIRRPAKFPSQPLSYDYRFDANSFVLEGGRWRGKREPGLGLRSGVYHLETESGQPNFPICQDCFSILPAFINQRANRAQRKNENDIDSLEVLYKHLRRQFLKDPETQGNELYLQWPQRSYMGEPSRCLHEFLTTSWTLTRSWYQESSSQPIPSLPKYILSRLVPVQVSTSQKVNFLTLDTAAPRFEQASPLLNLPAELLHQITSYLPYHSLLSLRECSLLLSQAIPLNQGFWYKHFMNKDLFGFLLAHDSQDVVKEIERRALKRGLGPDRYDWIDLVGKLADWTSFEYGGCFQDAPAGFRNRRRVWKVLESMEWDDDEEEEEEEE